MKSSNEIGTVLLDWILDAKMVEKRQFKQLHIWVDNCSGKNKNYYLCCLLLFVIQIGLLDKIFLEFLVSIFWQHLLIIEIVLKISFMKYIFLMINIVYISISLLISIIFYLCRSLGTPTIHVTGALVYWKTNTKK